MTIIVIPAYNEEKTVGEAVRNAALFCDEVIVVNDGSRDGTAAKASAAGATVLTHVINRRYTLGAALRTGIQGALLKGADIIVTFDADLQHDAGDIPRLIKPIEQGKADVVIGSRFIKNSKPEIRNSKQLLNYLITQLPKHGHRRLGGMIANILTLLLYGIHATDSQSGLRAFSRLAASKLKLESMRMEVSSEIIGELFRHNCRILEIPICPIYTAYALSKGQGWKVGFKTAWHLILRRFLS